MERKEALCKKTDMIGITIKNSFLNLQTFTLTNMHLSTKQVALLFMCLYMPRIPRLPFNIPFSQVILNTFQMARKLLSQSTSRRPRRCDGWRSRSRRPKAPAVLLKSPKVLIKREEERNEQKYVFSCSTKVLSVKFHCIVC